MNEEGDFNLKSFLYFFKTFFRLKEINILEKNNLDNFEEKLFYILKFSDKFSSIAIYLSDKKIIEKDIADFLQSNNKKEENFFQIFFKFVNSLQKLYANMDIIPGINEEIVKTLIDLNKVLNTSENNFKDLFNELLFHENHQDGILNLLKKNVDVFKKILKAHTKIFEKKGYFPNFEEAICIYFLKVTEFSLDLHKSYNSKNEQTKEIERNLTEKFNDKILKLNFLKEIIFNYENDSKNFEEVDVEKNLLIIIGPTFNSSFLRAIEMIRNFLSNIEISFKDDFMKEFNNNIDGIINELLPSKTKHVIKKSNKKVIPNEIDNLFLEFAHIYEAFNAVIVKYEESSYTYFGIQVRDNHINTKEDDFKIIGPQTKKNIKVINIKSVIWVYYLGNPLNRSFGKNKKKIFIGNQRNRKLWKGLRNNIKISETEILKKVETIKEFTEEDWKKNNVVSSIFLYLEKLKLYDSSSFYEEDNSLIDNLFIGFTGTMKKFFSKNESTKKSDKEDKFKIEDNFDKEFNKKFINVFQNLNYDSSGIIIRYSKEKDSENLGIFLQKDENSFWIYNPLVGEINISEEDIIWVYYTGKPVENSKKENEKVSFENFLEDIKNNKFETAKLNKKIRYGEMKGEKKLILCFKEEPLSEEKEKVEYDKNLRRFLEKMNKNPNLIEYYTNEKFHELIIDFFKNNKLKNTIILLIESEGNKFVVLQTGKIKNKTIQSYEGKVGEIVDFEIGHVKEIFFSNDFKKKIDKKHIFSKKGVIKGTLAEEIDKNKGVYIKIRKDKDNNNIFIKEQNQKKLNLWKNLSINYGKDTNKKEFKIKAINEQDRHFLVFYVAKKS